VLPAGTFRATQKERGDMVEFAPSAVGREGLFG